VGEARWRRPDPVELPPVPRLATARLSDELAERIRRFIISEDIAAGARLPPERELAERLGASRPTVSQALRSLSLMGLVEIRRGSGVYVVRRPEAMVTASVSLMLDLDQRSLADLMQLRLWLETLGAREAAARRPELTAAEAAALTGALAHLREAAGEPATWIAADTVFHAAVVRAAGNHYLGSIYESVHTAVLSSEFRQWVDREQVPDWLRHTGPQQQFALHEPIAAAVLRRDPDAAARAVAAHHRVMLEHLAVPLTTPGRPPEDVA
jgi:GntR family transcriptional repressor for pyruvate dehydrogenase complex